MPVQQSDIDALNAALAHGEKIVRVNNKTIEYRSPAEIIKARDDLQRQLNAQNATPRPRQVRLGYGGRGY